MADPIVEKTMFDRHFDGMAGESDMPRKLVARLCWNKRAEIAERHEKELVAALRELIGWVPGRAAWHTDASLKAVERARAVLSNYSDEVVV